MLVLKNSFKKSFKTLPQSFRVEDSKYITSIGQVTFAFSAFGFIILFLILIYIALRFCCKKCVGPIKINQITRTYRNITWVLMSKYKL